MHCWKIQALIVSRPALPYEETIMAMMILYPMATATFTAAITRVPLLDEYVQNGFMSELDAYLVYNGITDGNEIYKYLLHLN